MLARSNLSIRRLMPQRRQNSDEHLFWDNDEDASLKFTDGRGSPTPSLKVEGFKRHNSKLWLSKGSTKRIPQPIIVVRDSEDLHRITNLPPLPDTPHSSKSSLCSCEQHTTGHASPRRLPGRASPGLSLGHGPIRSKTHIERSVSSPPGSPLENPRPSPRLPTEIRRNNKSTKSLPSPTKLTFDLLEALEIPPDNEAMTKPIPIIPPRHRSTSNLDKDLDRDFANIQDSLPEENRAFHPVGVPTRREEKPQGDSQIQQQTYARPSSPPTRPAPALPAGKGPAPLKHKVLQKRPSTAALPPLKSPKRSASVSKTKRQRSQKSRNVRSPQTDVQKERSKWALNTKDLLSLRLFNRLEVDEVLSPARLQVIRLSGTSQIPSRTSLETLRTIQSDGSETPVDPFNLQDLPTRIGAAGVRLSIPSPVVEVPTPRAFDFGLAAKGRQSSIEDEENSTISGETLQELPEEEADDAMSLSGLSFPAPPAKNPARFASTTPRDTPQLPSIPKLLITTPENFTLDSRPVPSTPRPSADDPFIHLRGTPFTMTMRTFRHGPIRIAKADVAPAYSASKLATAVLDDSLDWTAFHMAILGGAGDLLGESTDYSRRDSAEEAEVDDLCEWFAGFGFAGYGTLGNGCRPVSPRPSSTVTTTTTVEGKSCPPAGDSSSRSSESGLHLPIPVEQEFPTGFWNGRLGQNETGKEANTRFDRARSVGLRRWTLEGHPKRYEGNITMSIDSSRRPSVDSLASLPQSPMLDLVVSQDVGGNEYVVPMGYNLSHDLGDFLIYEAQNLYIAAFMAGTDGIEAELEG